MKSTAIIVPVLSLALLVRSVSGQTPLGTPFAYQGRLKQSGQPADGLHDLRFRLYGALLGGGAGRCDRLL